MKTSERTFSKCFINLGKYLIAAALIFSLIFIMAYAAHTFGAYTILILMIICGTGIVIYESCRKQ